MVPLDIRPEVTKLPPPSHCRPAAAGGVRGCTCNQHREMFQPIQGAFGLRPYHLLETMSPRRSLNILAARLLESMDAVLEQERPDWVSSFDLISHVRLVLSDSGGIQEDAPTFGTPVVVMRQHAERMEGVHAGFVTLSVQGAEAIEGAVDARLGDEVRRSSLRAWPNPYGDDQASARILGNLLGEPCEYFHG